MRRFLVIAAIGAALAAGRLTATSGTARYQYDHTNIGPSSLLTRIDRVSGRAEILYPGDGWRDASAPRPADWQ